MISMSLAFYLLGFPAWDAMARSKRKVK